MLAAKLVRLGVDQATPIEIDNPNRKLKKDPLKAKGGRDLPTIRQVRLRLAPDEYNAGAYFFFAGAVSLHALRSQTPLFGVGLRVHATIMYRERC